MRVSLSIRPSIGLSVTLFSKSRNEETNYGSGRSLLKTKYFHGNHHAFRLKTRLYTGTDTILTGKAKKIAKIEKKFFHDFDPWGAPLRGPISRHRGRISKNASMSLIIWLQGPTMPNFMVIGPVVWSEPILGQEIWSLFL